MDREKNKKLIIWYLFLWVLLIIALYLAYGVYFIDTTSTKSKWVGLFAGVLALMLGACKGVENSYFCYKIQKLEEIINYFKTGSKTFFKSTNKFAIIFAIILGIFLNKFIGYKFIICYATGVISTILCLSLINILTIQSSVKISYSTSNHSNKTQKLAYNCAIATSFIIIAFVISAMVILFHIFKDYEILNGYVLGVGVITLFYTLVNTITKKATSNAITTFSQIQPDLEKNDKRNPLLLLNGISSNLFKIDILSFELIEIFSAVLISAMTVGGYCYNLMGAFLPIIICASGIFSCILTILFTKIKNSNNPTKQLFGSAFISILILCLILYYVIKTWLPNDGNIIFSIMTGAIGGLVLCFININCISEKYKPIKNISNASNSGFYSIVSQTLKEGFKSTFAPIVVIALTTILSFLFAYGLQAPAFGLYGITMAALGSLCTLGIINSIGVFALSEENISHIEDTYEENIATSASKKYLQENSNNVLKMTKNFLNANNIIAALCVLIAYTIVAEIEEIDILNPYVMASLFIGAVIPYLFSGLILSNAIKTTGKLIMEAKKQLRHFPQILSYEMRPNYEHTVEIGAYNGSIKAIFIILVLIAIFSLIGINLKQEALGGFIMGAILGSIGLVLTISNSNNAIKGAKKYFLNEYKNAPQTEEYGAISNADIMFNIFGDLITPCIGSIIKFIAILALAIAPMYL